MARLIPFVCLWFVAATSSAVYGATLTVVVSNIADSQGAIMIEVLPNEAAFKDEAPSVASFILPARSPEVTLSLDALDEGEYGIRVMHDTNGDGELNANMLGMPKEPWGFSNNASGNFGPPKWKDVKFELDSATEQSIELNH